MTAMPVANLPIALGARAIGARLGSTEVLRGIGLAITQGCWTSIVGPNGAGKSTLLKVLAGLLPHTGQVTLLGQPLNSLPRRARAQQLSWLGQNEASADDLTAYDVVMLGRLPPCRAPQFPALPDIDERLESVIFHREPVHVPAPVRAACAQRHDVIDLEPRTGAATAPGRRTSMLASERAHLCA